MSQIDTLVGSLTGAFGTSHTGTELAQLLRQVANEIDREDITWTHLHHGWDTEEDEDNKLWKTWRCTGGGYLRVEWEPTT